jgi:hypothetical protein
MTFLEPARAHPQSLSQDLMNFLLLIPTMTVLVMLVRWFQEHPLFIDRNWRFCLVTHGESFSFRKTSRPAGSRRTYLGAMREHTHNQ